MSGRVLAFSKASPAPVSLDEFSPFSVFSTTSVPGPVLIDRETEMESRVNAFGLGCIRGAVFALALEAVAGIVIYTAWHLLHILR